MTGQCNRTGFKYVIETKNTPHPIHASLTNSVTTHTDVVKEKVDQPLTANKPDIKSSKTTSIEPKEGYIQLLSLTTT